VRDHLDHAAINGTVLPVTDRRSGQTSLELLRQEDDGTIGIHVDLVIFVPFVLRSADGTTYNLHPWTSRSALAPVIDLLEGTVAGVTIDGDDTVEHDIAGNPINALSTLTVDFSDGARLTVPPVEVPYQSWELNYGDYLTLLFLSRAGRAWTRSEVLCIARAPVRVAGC
jgi:hypothetical protein